MIKRHHVGRLTLCLTVLLVSAPLMRAQDRTSPLQVPSGFDLPEAMTLLYGNYDSKSGYSTLTMIPDPNGAYPTLAPGEVWDVRPYFIAVVPNSGRKEFLLATYAIPDDEPDYTCPACQPFIGAALLKEGPGGLTVEASRSPNGTVLGAWGRHPDAELFEFGPHLTGIKLTLEGQHQGDEQTSVILLVPWAGGFSEAFCSSVEGNNSAECGPGEGMMDCFRFHANLTFMRGKNPVYYDLVVRTYGTDWNGVGPRGVKNVSGVKHLHFVDGKYVPVRSE